MSTETRLAVLENEMEKMDGFFSRLDTSIEKITELNVSIREVLASHETRLNTQEEELESQFKMFDQRYEQLHSRISTVQRELSGEVQSETTKVMQALTDLRKEIRSHAEKEEDRVRSVERRQWMIMGAAAVAGFILGNTSIMQLFG